jgi:hypothetical protein
MVLISPVLILLWDVLFALYHFVLESRIKYFLLDDVLCVFCGGKGDIMTSLFF